VLGVRALWFPGSCDFVDGGPAGKTCRGALTSEKNLELESSCTRQRPSPKLSVFGLKGFLGSRVDAKKDASNNCAKCNSIVLSVRS
jgi:hypothetical protein